MRINQFIASATGVSRRQADQIIFKNRVLVNGHVAQMGQVVSPGDKVMLDDQIVKLPEASITIMLNKPVDYVCSRRGQGSKTIYSLLPPKLHYLKPIGRLDKNSSGLLLLTNDGKLANELTHPKFRKEKIYQLQLDKELSERDRNRIEGGVELEDGISKLKLSGNGREWTVTMSEGRNRQIRRTFAARGYKVKELHRTHFGAYKLKGLISGKYSSV